MTRLLIVGVPRSGTTWVGRALGSTAGTAYVNEPDGDHDPWAFRARIGHPVAPVLTPGEDAPDVERLWRGAFAGGCRARTLRDRLSRRLYGRVPVAERWEAWLGGAVSPRLRVVAALATPLVGDESARHVVVKSVRSEHCVEWIVDRFAPRVLVVERNPLNVLASWHELGFVRDPREAAAAARVAVRWGVEPLGPDADLVTRQAFTYATLCSALREAAGRHADWVRTTHEELCIDTEASFRALVASVGLEWCDAVAGFLADSDREGSGYRTERHTGDQPERWRERLTDEHVVAVRETLGRFPAHLVPAL